MSEIPRHWRLKEERYSLVGKHCMDCEYNMFPPRDNCTDCGSGNVTSFKFSGNGEVYSFTTIYKDSAPSGYTESTPYTVGLVKLDEGPTVTAQLTDLHGEVQIGMRVEVVTRKLRNDGDERGLIIYGYKFRPSFSQEVSRSSK